jgi:hypothetical protein
MVVGTPCLEASRALAAFGDAQGPGQLLREGGPRRGPLGPDGRRGEGRSESWVQRHVGQRVLILMADLDVWVINEDGELIRHFKINSDRNYQRISDDELSTMS